jgi:prepilin-type N-terminal cleavage/methylation domain-containing protein
MLENNKKIKVIRKILDYRFSNKLFPEPRTENRESDSGFTLIELLIVIAIIAILAAAVFVALDPLTRFRDTRDATRASEISEILSAIKIDQVDNGGAYLSAIDSLTNGSTYMIVDGDGGSAMATGCDDNDGVSGVDCDMTNDTACVDLDGLVTEGYLGDVPVSPTGVVTWDDGDTAGDEGTGYTLTKASTGIITIAACESENTTEISASR